MKAHVPDNWPKNRAGANLHHGSLVGSIAEQNLKESQIPGTARSGPKSKNPPEQGLIYYLFDRLVVTIGNSFGHRIGQIGRVFVDLSVIVVVDSVDGVLVETPVTVLVELRTAVNVGAAGKIKHNSVAIVEYDPVTGCRSQY